MGDNTPKVPPNPNTAIMAKMVKLVTGLGNILRRHGVPEAKVEPVTQDIFELISTLFMEGGPSA